MALLTTPPASPVKNIKLSDVPEFMKNFMDTDNRYVKGAITIYVYVQNFILYNLQWLKESSGQKTLLIKLPEAIVSISKRIGPATHIPGRMINAVASLLMPIQRLGGCASSLIGFAEIGYKFPAMFTPSAERISYLVEANDQTYTAYFPLNSWEQRADKALSVTDWTLSFTGCVGYLWRLNHSPNEKFPLAEIATWAGRYISLKGLYSEGRFLYETLWVGPQFKCPENKPTTKNKPITNPQPRMKLATVELVGSLLKLSLAVVCLSVEIFRALAVKRQSPWIDTALFCASIAPAFITPLATRYWPELVIKPIRNKSVLAVPITG
ncbi:MAG TPA: hypothetical protein VHK67_00465 [Rhabdochlamydiaceae bacterium]|jgi:hypothetical protein|nr:hypothetical protein [Rhabdochlamydiaceae bacterium]